MIGNVEPPTREEIMLLSDVPVLAAHHAPDVAAIQFGDRVVT